MTSRLRPASPASMAPERAEQVLSGLQRIEVELGLGQDMAERVLVALMRATGCTFDAAVETVLLACQPQEEHSDSQHAA